ncbi:glycosyltransferase [Actinoplanes sp. NPDC051411]|uniref:glycosyltransferase n=1 Tax=Actinoplanes sp. NPDC051411 TaxID=3155522 RepID=UPI00344813F3
MSPDNRVVIWRSALLSGSETFVRNHGDHLTRWTPAYLGATRTESPLARETDVIAYPWESDRLAFLRLRLTGESPRLRRLLAVARPDLVHAHFAGDGWLVSDSARRLGVPLIVTTHGHDVTRQPDSDGLKGVRYRRNLRSVFDRASLIIAVSEVIRERAIARGADPSRVRVHHTGVPVPPALPSVSPSWDVTFIGRFVDKKGADDLVAALGKLGPARALFIGDGPLRPQVEAQARSLGVDATFTGALPPAEVTSRLAASRILAAPSRTAADGDTEGLPTTVLEAGALGVPVVSTFHSGIPEAVVDGVTGLLGGERDVEALSANIGRLLSDEPLRERLGQAARAHVASNFNLATQSRRLEDLYDEVVANRLQRL